MEFIVYNMRVAMLVMAFYMAYRLLLSKETYLRTNRVVLLLMVSLSFVLPNVRLTFEQGRSVIVDGIAGTYMLDDIIISSSSESVAMPIVTRDDVVVWVYVAGVVFFVMRLMWSMLQLGRELQKGEKRALENGVTLVLTEENTSPFSWLRYVSMSRRDYAECRDEVLMHELAHIHYGHSVDLMAMDIACCIQWFNPAMWLMRSELCAVHEYEADKAVLDSGINAKQYQILLIKKAAGSKWSSIANSFNHSKLKNRITMMLRKESSGWARAKVLSALPIIGGAMIVFANVACVEGEDSENLGHDNVLMEDNQDLEQNGNKSLKLSYENVASATPYEREKDGHVVACKYVLKTGEEVIVRDGKYEINSGEKVIVGSGNQGETFLIAEEMPVFPSGDDALRQYLATNVVYPQEAKDKKIEGRVFVSFVVDEEGDVVEVHAAREYNPVLDAEAMRVVGSMPKWTPGKQRGVPVRVSYTVPINFVLN